MGYAYPVDSKVVTNPNGTIDYDRASSSTQLRGLIKSMITNGVNLTESTNLQVMADEETMNLVVKPGYVIIEGALKHFEDDAKVTIGVADTNNPRIDTVVARLNLNEDVRDIVIDVLQGTPSAEPTAPELTRTTSYYEVGLADILVEVGATQISQAVVTDTRLLNSRCGMISAIGEIDTETLFNQLTTDFDNWFESIKGKLGDDVAGNLQIQVNDLQDDVDTLQNDVSDIKNMIYPIGSIYLSVNDVNPSEIFGGTWERFGKGKTLVGVNESDTDFSTVEKTGGEKTHKLTVDEMPSHTHESYVPKSTQYGQYHYTSEGSNRSEANEAYTTSSTGGSQAHNNLQPYITVYMWKRVA